MTWRFSDLNRPLFLLSTDFFDSMRLSVARLFCLDPLICLEVLRKSDGRLVMIGGCVFAKVNPREMIVWRNKEPGGMGEGIGGASRACSYYVMAPDLG